MSRVDTAWLRMDSPSNLMMILGVWVLRPAVDHAALCRRVTERLLPYARFLQRVEHDAAGARWVPDADFRIERHVLRETLPRPRATPGLTRAATEQAALQQRLAELAVTPLDAAHPLWQFHLIEHYQGGSALLARIHHCIADGIALIAVMQSLVDGGSPPALRPAAAEPPAPQPGGAGLQDWLTQALLQPATTAVVQAIDHTGAGVAQLLDLLADPRQLLRALPGANPSAPGPLAGELGRLALQFSRDAAALALMADDSPTRLKGQPGRVKRVAWCEPIALDEVKAVGRALGCSVNDVLLSCVAGALGGYLRERGDPVDGQEIRAMVPVNLRPLEQAQQLGNRFGLAPVVLPIGLQHPLERLYAVRRRMGELKGSLQPLLAFGLLAVAGLLVKPAQDALLGLFSRKTTAVMTNVPGPARKLRLCGATLEQSLFWVPQSGTVGLGVSILSYGGGVQFGVISDAGLCPDPQAIIDRFEPEFTALSMLTLMLPWGD